MKFEYTIKKHVTTDFKYLKVLVTENEFMYQDIKIGDTTYEDSLDDFFDEYPDLNEDGYLKLIINIETGHVVNWPKNCAIDLHTKKVVDTGVYALMETEDGNIGEVLEYEGYVPRCVGDEYGDYLEFEIDNDSNIPDWKFDEDEFDDFMENYKNSVDENED